MSQNNKLDRRSFIKTSLAGAAGTTALLGTGLSAQNETGTGQAPKITGYRTLGRTGFKVSDIGLGTGIQTNANVFAAAFEMGVNYVDTGEHYSRGASERATGEALKTWDRKKIFVTTKLNLLFLGEQKATKEGLKERFAKCLGRLQTDYVDCLMIHMTSTADQVKHEGFHAAARELKAEGRIRFIGLSNHGPEQRIYGNTKEPMEKVLMAAVEDGRFDVALFVYNFLQKEQGEKIIRACREKDMGVTLMKTNPVNVYKRWKTGVDQTVARGRKPSDATVKMDEEYQAYLKAAEVFKRKYGLESEGEIRDAAIKFCLSNDGVHSVCPSIGSFEELETLVKLSGQKLTTAEAPLLAGYGDTLGRFYCRHACGACETACPHAVPVNTIMRYNHYFEAQGREKYAMAKYAEMPRSKADRCGGCSGVCESLCPHGVPVRSLLAAAHDNLTLV
ncbi:aldo/keto reductase [Acidobacteriota bacterium]